MLSTTKLQNKIIDVPPGHREDCDDDVLYEQDIDYKFHQGNGITCAWSATSILVDLVCRKTADKMIKLRNEDENKYSNIHLMRGHDSVSNLLTKHTRFELKRVKDIGDIHERADNIMKRDSGLFVCVLSDINGSTNHCIGIDCKTRLMYDAVDLKAKRLTKENIEYSAGM